MRGQRVYIQHQGQPAGLRLHDVHAMALKQQILKINSLDHQAHRAGLDASHVEQGIDQLIQMLGAGMDRPGELAQLGFGTLAVVQ